MHIFNYKGKELHAVIGKDIHYDTEEMAKILGYRNASHLLSLFSPNDLATGEDYIEVDGKEIPMLNWYGMTLACFYSKEIGGSEGDEFLNFNRTQIKPLRTGFVQRVSRAVKQTIDRISAP